MNPTPTQSVIYLRPARAGEAEALSELALRSKGSWGYDEAFLAACREELTLTPGFLDEHPTVVAVGPGEELLGFYSLGRASDERGEIELFYVEPSRLGEGIGRRLFEHLLAEARRLGFRTLVVQSDPHAEPFYRRMGGVPAGTRPSGSIPGRSLPLLELDLGA